MVGERQRGGSDEAVITPEAVPLELATATVGSRGVAAIVDLLVLGATVTALGLAVSQLAAGAGGALPDWIGVSILLVAALAVLLGYPAGFETLWRGRTPGKAAMGLRVVTREGGPIGFRHAIVRAIFGLVELLGTLGAVAVVTALISRRGQRLGDLAAGTVVLRERSAGGPARAIDFEPPAGLEAYVGSLDVGLVSPRDYQTVRTLLVRADQLTGEARRRLARRLADDLLGRVRPPPPAATTAEAFLRCVAAAYQRRGARTAASTRDRPATSEPTGQPRPSRPPGDDRRVRGESRRPDGGFTPPG